MRSLVSSWRPPDSPALVAVAIAITIAALVAPSVSYAQASVPIVPSIDDDDEEDDRLPPTVQPPVTPPAPSVHRAAPPSGDLDVERRVSLNGVPSAQAAIDGDVAFVPLRGSRLVAIDLARSRRRWTAEIAAAFPPAVGDGLVFVAEPDALSALSANDGSRRWRLPIAGGFTAPPLWRGGWLVVAASSGDILCLRATDGHVVWTAPVRSPVRSRAALTADRVYVSVEDGRVAAFELGTGAVAWERTLGGSPGPVLALDDRVFVGAADRFFYCLDATDGNQKWRFRMGAGIIGEPVIDDRYVYSVAYDNVLRALHRWNGSQHWKQGLTVRPSGAPLLVDSILYVAGVAAELYAYRVSDGNPAGKFAAPADLVAPPQLMHPEADLLSAIVLLTRAGEIQVLRRRVEPAVVPLDHIPGVPVPLTPPESSAPTA
jgi:outer membrane protein assembly factor BamB